MSKTFLRFVAALILLASIISPVNAFNNYGHMSVGYVAFQNLTPQTRSKANALLAKNPDFPNRVAMIPPGTADSDTNLVLFMIATTWADRIKSAGGFTEDNTTDRNKCGPLSEQNIGFTDHLRHRCWHFIDVAFTQDNTTPLPSTPTPNAQERVEMFRPILGSTDEDLKAYDLSWILHLVGDLHQPLHCVTRVGAGQTDGDAGGNFVEIQQGQATNNLHAFWDNLLGPSTATAKTVIKTAKLAVYIAPVQLGAGPFGLTKKYQKDAKALVKKQVALAGERLANLLNADLK